jgi:hypothetical protein
VHGRHRADGRLVGRADAVTAALSAALFIAACLFSILLVTQVVAAAAASLLISISSLGGTALAVMEVRNDSSASACVQRAQRRAEVARQAFAATGQMRKNDAGEFPTSLV